MENNKSFVKIPFGTLDNIMLIPDSTAKMIAVLSATEAAVFSSSDYCKINFDDLKTSGNYTFNMKTQAVTTIDYFIEMLN